MENIYRQSIHREIPIAVPAADGRRYGYYVMPIAVLMLMFLAGCASLSKEECSVADWYSIGLEDGSKGYDMSRLGAHRKACAKVGVVPDADRYAQGREVGLQTFCTRERGYYEGERGRAYRGVCPPQFEPLFMQGYLAGQEVYRINQDIRRLEGELTQIRQEIADIRAGLDDGYTIDESGKKNPINKYERDAMYERLLFLGREEGRLEGEITVLRQSL